MVPRIADLRRDEHLRDAFTGKNRVPWQGAHNNRGELVSGGAASRLPPSGSDIATTEPASLGHRQGAGTAAPPRRVSLSPLRTARKPLA